MPPPLSIARALCLASVAALAAMRAGAATDAGWLPLASRSPPLWVAGGTN